MDKVVVGVGVGVGPGGGGRGGEDERACSRCLAAHEAELWLQGYGCKPSPTGGAVVHCPDACKHALAGLHTDALGEEREGGRDGPLTDSSGRRGSIGFRTHAHVQGDELAALTSRFILPLVRCFVGVAVLELHIIDRCVSGLANCGTARGERPFGTCDSHGVNLVAVHAARSGQAGCLQAGLAGGQRVSASSPSPLTLVVVRQVQLLSCVALLHYLHI